MSYKVTYTADDEEPDCMMCDHVCGWVWRDYKSKNSMITVRNIAAQNMDGMDIKEGKW